MDAIRITVHDPAPSQLLLCGVPIAAGALPAGGGLRLTCADEALPLWWEERAHWPDGSVRWVFLHGRLPALDACDTLDLQLHDAPAIPGPGPALADGCLQTGDLQFTCLDDGWRVTGAGAAWTLHGRRVRVGDEELVFGDTTVELLQASPIAPVLRLRAAAPAARLDELIRLDPVGGAVHWQQRLSWLGAAPAPLQQSVVQLTTTSGDSWRWLGVEGSSPRHGLHIPRPGWWRRDDEPAQRGHPVPALVRGDTRFVVDKPWQRAPLGLRVAGDTIQDGAIQLELFPGDAPPLTLHPGTSLRHSVRLGLTSSSPLLPARWSIDPAQACDTGALGPLMARSPDTQRRFPGYEQAIDACLHAGRLTRLDQAKGDPTGPPAALPDEASQDEEYFALQHYGDWPMAMGAYGGTRRMYADNEYDTPYAYWIGFLRTGVIDYVDIAYHSAVHMADLDCKADDGDMRFHGYRDTADDHDAHRVSRGDLGHYWTDGLVFNWLLADDWWGWEAAQGVADHLMQRFHGDGDDPIRRAFLGCERAVGWPLVALAGVAEVNGDAALTAKMTQMVAYLARFTADPDRELEDVPTDASGEPIQWWRICQQDGTKPFMLGVVMEGLERHHRLTGDPAAEHALVAIARFLVDVMWVEQVEAFIYEWNAFNRGHRAGLPHYINLMVAPGLAYAHELTGESKFRDVATRSFHAALWTLFAPGGGKEIGMVGRTSAMMVGRLDAWRQRAEAAVADAMLPSQGTALHLAGELDTLAADPRLIARPVAGLAPGAAVYDLREAASTDRGRLALTITPSWDCPTHPGPVAQRAYLHLCDRPFTASCVSLISFYTGLHVRFHDADRHHIEVLETSIEHWRAHEPHRIEVVWDVEHGTARLSMDGDLVDERPLARRLSGAFARLHLGHRPGHWRADAQLTGLEIDLG